jgi:ATP-dependent protease ClpP protease subunit
MNRLDRSALRGRLRMSIRSLPKVAAPALRAGLGFDIEPSALSRFDSSIRAADEKDDAAATISILGPIGEDWWTGEGITARRVAAALRAIGDRDVVVHVNSPGGDYFEGLAIYNLLREHPRQVTVKVLGIAASAASVIAMAGDRVEVPRAGFLMIHNVWIVAIGDRNDLRDAADLLEPFDQVAADVYAARSGMDIKDIRKMMDRETWIGGQDAVDKGFADDLLPADKVEKNASGAQASSGVERRVERFLAKGGMPRAERLRVISELKAGTRDAADDTTRDAGVNADLAKRLADIGIR